LRHRQSAPGLAGLGVASYADSAKDRDRRRHGRYGASVPVKAAPAAPRGAVSDAAANARAGHAASGRSPRGARLSQ